MTNIIREISHTHFDIHRLKSGIKRGIGALESDHAGIIPLQEKVKKLELLLREHIVQEEEELFPIARDILGDDCCGEVDDLEREHILLLELANELVEAVSHVNGAMNVANIMDVFARFDALMEQHSDAEAVFLDTNANLINPASAGGG